jgi:hypothetical protein
MKTMLIAAAILSSNALADTAVDDFHCDAKTGQCEHRTIMLHEKPMTQAEAKAADAKMKQSDQDKATAKANAKAHVTDCASGKLTGDACSGSALAKDIAALIPSDP